MPVNIKHRQTTLVAAVLILGAAACGPAPAPDRPAANAVMQPPGTGGREGPPAGTVVAVTVATNARLGKILVSPSGRTLYRSSDETAGGIATLTCVGACLKAWHPLPVPPADLQPLAGPGVPGRLGVISRPDGTTQVSWQNSPLYTYAGDTAPGQVNGQGIDHVWSVVQVRANAG